MYTLDLESCWRLYLGQQEIHDSICGFLRTRDALLWKGSISGSMVTPCYILLLGFGQANLQATSDASFPARSILSTCLERFIIDRITLVLTQRHGVVPPQVGLCASQAWNGALAPERATAIATPTFVTSLHALLPKIAWTKNKHSYPHDILKLFSLVLVVLHSQIYS